LENPAILGLVQDQLLPMLPATDLDIKVALE
jgi:hypothetical protein